MLSDADEARRIEIERDYRRQVRKAWYLREEDFDSLKEYNDYLEETEARPHGCARTSAHGTLIPRPIGVRSWSRRWCARRRGL